MCNPPFHSSLEDAQKGNQRKVKNLSKGRVRKAGDRSNFGGQNAELWCPGGEVQFVDQMIRESAEFAGQVGWFTSLVSKSENLRPLKKVLKQVGARRIKVIEMSQGQKQSRLLVWRFGA